jgi:sulfur carrier protein ThiS adenylyltransferase
MPEHSEITGAKTNQYMLALAFNEIKAMLSAKVVGIAGAGGLGSNCAVALARVGVGKLVIADFDIVSQENLNRQYFFASQVGQKKVDALRENIAAINPSVVVETHDLRLDRENIPRLFGGCDIIVEAFDLAEMKLMIAETVIENFPDKYLVMGSGLAGFGNNNSIRTTRTGNIFVCGDLVNETSDRLPPLGPRVGIVANMQANQVLELLISGPEC